MIMKDPSNGRSDGFIGKQKEHGQSFDSSPSSFGAGLESALEDICSAVIFSILIHI
jgi:hypothetical protein